MLKLSNIPFTQDEPLAQKSTFKIGGKAKIFITPQTQEQLSSCIGAVRNSEIPFFVMGGASNLVFPDEEFNGAIISTQNLKNIYMEDNSNNEVNSDNKVLVTCQCGCSMAAFVDFCTKKNLSGAEQFAGLPGTVGGAVYMNARCFERSISDFLHSTTHLEFSEKKACAIHKEFSSSEWEYKNSPFQKTKEIEQKYVLDATFELLQLPNNNRISEDCKFFISQRVSKEHFKFPSAGSVFKNNRAFGKPSGKIIDEVGLKGYKIGGAQVAPFHGNFIINTGSAKAKDVKQLVFYIQETVKNQTGFFLEPEIIFV